MNDFGKTYLFVGAGLYAILWALTSSLQPPVSSLLTAPNAREGPWHALESTIAPVWYYSTYCKEKAVQRPIFEIANSAEAQLAERRRAPKKLALTFYRIV